MPKVKVEVEVSKEAHELAVGSKKVILGIKEALKDGWQPGQDLPVVLNAVLMDLVPAVQGVEKLGDEAKEDVGAFVSAFLVEAKDLAVKLLK